MKAKSMCSLPPDARAVRWPEGCRRMAGCEPASNRDPVRFRSSSLIGVEYDCRGRVPIGADWDPSHSGVFSGYFSWLRQYWLGSRFGADSQPMARMPRATVIPMPRAPASFLTNCSDFLKGWPGRRLSLNWQREARAKACGPISRLVCAACGDEDQISNTAPRVRRAPESAPEVLSH